MAPIRKGDGTGFTPKGFAGVRKGDGTILYSAEPAIPDSGVARWTFDDADTSDSTAVDVWNDNNGTINGATTGVGGSNQTYTTNEAYDFDGTDDYVAIDQVSDQINGSQQFSVCAWGYATNLPSGGSGGSPNDNQLINIGADTVFILARDDGTWRYGILEDGGTYVQASSSTSYNENVWIHHVVTWDGATVRGYQDGAEVTTASGSGDADGGRQDSRIGSTAPPDGSSSRVWDGRIDDIRIYNKALTASEVDNLYNAGCISG